MSSKFYLPDEQHAYVKHTPFGSNATGTMLNPFGEMVRGYKDGSSGRITSIPLDQDLDIITEGLMARQRCDQERHVPREPQIIHSLLL